MFESLNEKLELALKSLRGERTLTDLNIADSVKEIRRALVAADVNYKIAKEFTDKIKDKALGTENVLKAVKPGELMVKIVMDELVDLMGGQASGINLSGQPAVILIAGLQGSGKTTFTGKLSLFLKSKKNKKVLVVACDVYRPAAIDQLTVIAEQVGVEIFKDPDNKEPVVISRQAIEYAKANKFDVVIIDTAGRTSVDEDMMREIAMVKDAVLPQETLFVVDAMTGQDAVNTAATLTNESTSTAWYSPKWMVIPKEVLLCPSNTPQASRSSLSVREKRWMHWMYSIRTGWRSEFLAWVILYPL